MLRSVLAGLMALGVCGCELTAQSVCETVRENIILPEQRSIDYHDPAQLPPARVPDDPPPRTVSNPQPETADWNLSLDDAIRIALENARVIRVLAGTTAVSSGQTIYDPAITNTTIDQAQARFDPILSQNNTWNRSNSPFGVQNPLDPTQSLITSSPANAYTSLLGLSKTNVLGGQWQLNWTENFTRFPGANGLPLNPQTASNVALGYTQPLLQGAGFQVNTAPIVIARINTEQSYFQYKDSVQEMVRGVIATYWNLVQARTAVWSVKIQVQLSGETYKEKEAKLKSGLSGDMGTVAQALTSYNQFLANLVAAKANVLIQEGALRNLLGLDPSDGREIIPVSAPTVQRLTPDWDAIKHLAEQRRPDIVELKLVYEADRARLVLARDLTLPQLNAVALYRWNGLSGEMPNGEHISSRPGEFPDWSIGVNFSVPLGFRQGRAQVRQQELILARDRANVEQGVYAAVHNLAGTVRELDSAYDQFLAFKKTRAAADVNLRAQNEIFKSQVRRDFNYLNVLQALNDWGTAVTSEAQQLVNYNIALATLERQTGTILETHGLVFFEERFRAAGPLGVVCPNRLYPSAIIPAGAPHRYPGTGEPGENSFDLKNPVPRDEKPK